MVQMFTKYSRVWRSSLKMPWRRANLMWRTAGIRDIAPSCSAKRQNCAFLRFPHDFTLKQENVVIFAF
jgi:hypothetical protein